MTLVYMRPGPPGPPGPVGPIGPPAGPGYVHQQDAASSVWVIAHNLGRYPSVTVCDSSNRKVEGEVRYNSSNAVTVTFTVPFSGVAYLN